MNKVVIPRFGQLSAVCLQVLNRFPYGMFVDPEIDSLEIAGNLDSLQNNSEATKDSFHITFSVRSPSLKGTRLKVSFVLRWSASQWFTDAGQCRTVAFDHSDLKNLIRFVWLYKDVDWVFKPLFSNNLEETEYLRNLLVS